MGIHHIFTKSFQIMKKKRQIIFCFGLLFLALQTFAQQAPQINAQIKGRVLDAKTDEVLIGATVTIKGTTNGANTDENGEFRLITGQKLPFLLLVSYVGYQTKEVVIEETTVDIRLEVNPTVLADVTVSSRRRQESVQQIPIPISVIRGSVAEDAGAFNVNRIKELVPSVQLYSSNPRNTTLNIRGLGSTFGLTNDGIDQGVGFYIDGVYYARPAATSLDFVDIDRIEVLRGPQGTLFGKNTTAGAFHITTRAASFDPSASFETTFGNLGYIQAKASLSGPISKKLAARLSFSGTQRDGTLFNTRTQLFINDMNNLGFRGQLLYVPIEKVKITFNLDNNTQKPSGYGWPVAGVVTTKRPAYRQFSAILADLNYQLPYTSAFERIVDHDTPSKADNQMGGASINADIQMGKGVLTSTTAWRYWKWTPLNDRDYTGLPIFTVSAGNSVHTQFSQEIRYAGEWTNKLKGTVGLFGLWQNLQTDPVHTEEVGEAQGRFAQNSTSSLWRTEGLFNQFGIQTKYGLYSTSLAVFGQLDYAITPKLHLIPGIRYNYDRKIANYDRQTYGGLATTDPALLALKRAIYTNQQFDVDAQQRNVSGQATLQYVFSSKINTFATFSTTYKPIGVNVGGLPTANGRVLTELAEVKPEFVQHLEWGAKSRPSSNSILNVTFFSTTINDFQTQVQSPEPGVNRGYLANAEKVRVNGLELDGQISVGRGLVANGSFTYVDGRYVTFTNAPVPLEEVGGASAFKDISGERLPGISKYTGSIGLEATKRKDILDLKGNLFVGLDVFYRSSFSSSPTPSKYLNIEGYALTNLRAGFRATNGITFFVWGRNILDVDYYEQLLVAPGSAGQFAGVLGDPRTFGTTLRYSF